MRQIEVPAFHLAEHANEIRHVPADCGLFQVVENGRLGRARRPHEGHFLVLVPYKVTPLVPKKRIKAEPAISKGPGPGRTHIVLFGFNLVVAPASATSLNCRLEHWLATRSCDVPRLSNNNDCTLEMWTPSSRCIPEHSMQTITPKLVDSQVASRRTNKITS
jgi:hypothetical protein